MRKDVKIGLGIGGILLAVLIVYLLVPKTNEGNEYARTGDSSSTSDDHHGGADANAGTGGSNSSTTTNPGNVQRVGTVPRAPETGGNATASTPGQSGGADTDTDPDARATTLKKIDWETLLSQGIVPEDAKTPLAGVNNRGPSDDPFAADGKGSGAGEPNWAGTGGVKPPAAPAKPATPGRAGPTNSAAAPKSGLSEHVVKQGENLSTIALAAYGDAKLYKEILKANPGLDERKLKPGVTIKLPDAATFNSAKAQPAVAKQEKAVDSKTEYRVEPGDSLHKIAMKLYGKASKADTLYETNKDRIGDDSARLKVGTVLKLPEAPTASLQASAPMPR